VKHLSQKELVREGFGSFMKKVGGMAGGAVREFGKQLLKDAPTITSAATGMANIIKGGLDTDPLIAIKKYFETTTHGKTAFDDDIRQRDSLGKPKPDPRNKHKIDVPINKGTHIKDGKKEDMAGGRISLTRDDESGKWGINGFFTKDSEENLLPDGAPTVTGGRPGAGTPSLRKADGSRFSATATPGAPEAGKEFPWSGAEIKDSKGTPMKVGDRVMFTKGAKELKNIQGEIESIQGPEDITIRCGAEGCPPDNRASMAAVDPQMVVQVAAGAGADPGEPSMPDSEAEPPAEPSTTEPEAEPEPEALTFKPGDAVSYTNKKGKVNDGEFVKDLGEGKSEVKFTGGRAMAVSNNQLQAAEAPVEPEAEPDADAPEGDPDQKELPPEVQAKIDDAPQGYNTETGEKNPAAGARGREGPRAPKSDSKSAAARRIARALKSGRPPSREDIDMLKRAGVKGHQKIGGVTLRNLGRRTKLADSFSQKELLQHLTLLAR